MRRKLLLILFVLTFAAVAYAGDEAVCTTGVVADRAVILVEKAEHYVAEHGTEQAVAAFHDPNGPFIDGELYILFYDFDGICLANGFKPELAGQNRYDAIDPDGVHQIREMIKLAQADGGWVHYKFENPVTKTVDAKATYVKRAPGMDAFVGCGIYATQ